jgi:hypothetical protein
MSACVLPLRRPTRDYTKDCKYVTIVFRVKLSLFTDRRHTEGVEFNCTHSYARAPGGVSGQLRSPIVFPQVALLRYPLFRGPGVA